uniref:SWIM-type domain-containing protein n=1 Tax=Kalanchoe fedtschenkoi TaxID=63787 RepID=A0A7N0UW14_KALFE
MTSFYGGIGYELTPYFAYISILSSHPNWKIDALAWKIDSRRPTATPGKSPQLRPQSTRSSTQFPGLHVDVERQIRIPTDREVETVLIVMDLVETENVEEVANGSFEYVEETRDYDHSFMGKSFSTLEEAYDFYNEYARKNGFGIRKSSSSLSRRSREIIRKEFVCNKEGQKIITASTTQQQKQRRKVRTCCLAKMEVGLRSGRWIVDKFNDIHNHPLSSPSKVGKHRSHCKFHRSEEGRKLILDLHEAGLTPSQITKTMNSLNSNLHEDISAKQCSEALRTQKRKYVGKECHTIVRHFQERASSGEDFYFNVQLDVDGSLRSVFWADERSRTSYLEFGDVMVFDVTYKTNKFKMPFSPFVGVNHHRQTILFGGALLEDETEDTFVWLFEHFLKCMHNKPPRAVITDQDGAIRNVVKRVFPDARHRFCAWHIKKHVIEHTQPFRSLYKDFTETYFKWIKSKTPAEFEIGWDVLKEKYNLGKKGWFNTMYKERHHWVKCYLKDTFFAGMTTSGRSESIHSFFDGYVNGNTPLSEFVTQYDRAVESRRKSEENEDFRTMNSLPVLITEHGIEEDAGKIYTRKMFELFQTQWLASFSLDHIKPVKEKNIFVYNVGSKQERENVEYDSESSCVNCSCAKFETDGVLCKHILYILKKKGFQSLPKKYVLRRWTMDVRFRMGKSAFNIQGASEIPIDADITEGEKWATRSICNQIIKNAQYCPSSFKEFMNSARNCLSRLYDKMEANEVREKNDDLRLRVSTYEVPEVELQSHQLTILDPSSHKANKGRPPRPTRIKSGIEINTKIKKKSKCSECKEKGHNKTTCPKKMPASRRRRSVMSRERWRWLDFPVQRASRRRRSELGRFSNRAWGDFPGVAVGRRLSIFQARASIFQLG